MGQQLGRSIGRRSTLGYTQLALRVVWQAEINQFNVQILVQEQILNLQIPVKDTDAMKIVHGWDDLTNELPGTDLGQVFPGTYVVHQISTLTQFSHQIITLKKHTHTHIYFMKFLNIWLICSLRFTCFQFPLAHKVGWYWDEWSSGAICPHVACSYWHRHPPWPSSCQWL